jgi:hypothetical protein
MIRQAISPRFAIRIRLNMGCLLATLGSGFEPHLEAAGTTVTNPS